MTTLFDKAFHVAYVLYHVSFETARSFGEHMTANVYDDCKPLSMLELADWFEAWCSEAAVDAEVDEILVGGWLRVQPVSN